MMKQDERLRWLVESRNFIEKQGDLVTRSRFLVTLSNSWQDESPREFPLGKLAEYETVQASLTRGDVEKKVGERYPLLPTAFAGLKEAKTFREMCEAWFQGAKVFLQRDGFHAPMAIVGTDRAPLMFQLQPADRADQHAMMRDLASRCERAKARWCVFITEAWTKRSGSPYKHAANDPRHGEALVLHGVHEDGTKILCEAEFSREGKKIVLEPEKTTAGTLPPAMRAIAQAVVKSRRPSP